MKPDQPQPTRWLDQPAPGPLEQRAARMVSAADPPPELGELAYARIGRQLEQAAAPPARSRLPWAFGLAAACAGVALLGWRALPNRPDVAQDLLVPACGTARLDAHGQFQAALGGPGSVRFRPRTESEVELRAGKLDLRAHAGAVVVSTPDGRVRLARGATARIEVRDGRTIQVAAFRGEVTMEWSVDQRTLAVPSGTALGPEGAAPVLPTAEREAERALAGEAPTGCAPEEPAVAAPALVAQPVAPAPETPAPVRPPARARGHAEVATTSSLAAESHVLAQAIALLHKHGNPAAALAVLDQQSGALEHGALHSEAQVVRIDALLALQRDREALRALERLDVRGLPRERELRALRGELRAGADRCSDATADFQAARTGAADVVEERALYGLASCYARLSDPAAARVTLERYLERFPTGRYAAAARRALGE
jgi:hypothetical protein